MALQPHPELSELREYVLADYPVNVAAAATAPASAGSKASFIRVGTTVMYNTSLELVLANGTTRAWWVWPGWEMWIEYTSITGNTTCDTVEVGWV
jgi:hypothetical protein